MENVKIYYIVYNEVTLKIKHTSTYYNKVVHAIQNKAGNSLINVTHPKHKELLMSINNSNGTNY